MPHGVARSNATVYIDQLAFHGNGDLLGAPFFVKQPLSEAIQEGIWLESYYESPFSKKNTNATLRNGTLQVEYTVQQKELWGGFLDFAHLTPGKFLFQFITSAASTVGVQCTSESLHTRPRYFPICFARFQSLPTELSGRLSQPGTVLFVSVFLFVSACLVRERNLNKGDAIWKVNRRDLHFTDPPMVVGRGTYGLVLLAEYRGINVVVKRVIPPSDKLRKRNNKNK
jgi:hypothetical protein